jgi:hypothetical protein
MHAYVYGGKLCINRCTLIAHAAGQQAARAVLSRKAGGVVNK